MPKRFFKQLHLYGFSVAIWCFLFPSYRIFGPFKSYFAVYKHRSILKYLLYHYDDLIRKYSEIVTVTKHNIDPLSIIWVCWWDGEEAMPAIVKICYNSIKHIPLRPFIIKY
jgi:hypothetical protein